MKLRLLTTVALLTTVGFVAPVEAQTSQPVEPTTPSIQTQVSGDQVLQACSQDRADTLPIPYSDISPKDWAFKAVMSVYYCGAYRGSISPERVKPFLQPQPAQPTSNHTPTQRNFTQLPSGE
ncbi:MAG TPA: hypothetical protein V6C90_13665 [Coleofasciculaceae cyanobacterium]|jgi:hypothetical protein